MQAAADWSSKKVKLWDGHESLSWNTMKFLGDLSETANPLRQSRLLHCPAQHLADSSAAWLHDRGRPLCTTEKKQTLFRRDGASESIRSEKLKRSVIDLSVIIVYVIKGFNLWL